MCAAAKVRKAIQQEAHGGGGDGGFALKYSHKNSKSILRTKIMLAIQTQCISSKILHCVSHFQLFPTCT